MSAEMLRRAAVSIRNGQANYTPEHSDRFMLAVADWLDATADDWDRSKAPLPVSDIRLDARAALAVARAYLREDA